jgi:ParB family chromosome partitioning protein
MPLSVAIQIASADDAETQKILQQAYDQKLLRGNRLSKAKRLIEQRRRRGKTFKDEGTPARKPMSVEAVMKKYREDTQKKRTLVRKADMTRGRLMFIMEALRKVLSDNNFKTLLRAEGLDSIPKNLNDRLTNELDLQL